MNMSTIALLNLQHREKMVLAYYDDMGPGRGNCTWGPGLLAHRNPCTPEELARIVALAQAEAEFAVRVHIAERAVDRLVNVPLSQAQFDALVSFTYNRGVRGSQAAYKCANRGDFEGVAAEMSMRIGAEVKNNMGKLVKVHPRGLITRRAEESAPFRNAANAPGRSDAQ
jgi:lysozyme